MSTITFSKPVDKPLYGLGGTEVSGGKIASPLRKRTLNDPATFEITQDAAQHVASGVGSAEPAVDIGNGHCGEPILAMAQGWAVQVVDPSSMVAGTNALGVRIDHGAGVTSEYWHFDRWAIPATGTFVHAGEVIGYLGSTGLGGVCHCHLMIKVNGRAIDPEPYIFGKALVIEEEGLSVTTSGFKHVINRSTKLTVASNFRADATRQSDALNVYVANTAFVPTMQVTGEAIGTNSTWLGGWMYLPNKGYAFGFFHSSVLAPPAPVEQNDCKAEIERFDRAKSVLAKAVKEITQL